MSWEAFFFNLRRLLVIFCDRFSSACVWLKWFSECKHTNTQKQWATRAHTHTQMRRGACGLSCMATADLLELHPGCEGFGLGWVGLLILTAWPCLASCQHWACSCWLLWPPINQGQLPRRCTATSPPVAAPSCRAQGWREKDREATSLLLFHSLQQLTSSLFWQTLCSGVVCFHLFYTSWGTTTLFKDTVILVKGEASLSNTSCRYSNKSICLI